MNTATRRYGIFTLLPCLAALLCGCAVGPDYRPPNPSVPPQWIETAGGSETEAETVLTRWWTLFADPALDSLVERARTRNLDLKIAEARIRESRARRRGAAADLYPGLGVSGSYTHSLASESVYGVPSTKLQKPTASLENDFFQAGFDASWEPDLFGGKRRAVEAAEANIGASVESRRDVLVTLEAEIARNYFELRGAQSRLGVARDTIRAQEKTLELADIRYQNGLKGEIDVTRAKTQLASTRSRVPPLEASIRDSLYGLALLLALEPSALLDELTPEGPVPTGPEALPVGIPSDILRHRPDIRQAEREIASATASVGVATANLFPKFSITGMVGSQSLSLSDIALPASGVWSIGPTVSWPIFDAGRIRADIAAKNAAQEQAAARYEKAVLTALKDVESALSGYLKERERLSILAESVVSARKSVDLADDLYGQGLTDFLTVLDAQRSLYDQQDQEAQSRQNIAVRLAALFKALGGGWEEMPGQGNSTDASLSVKQIPILH